MTTGSSSPSSGVAFGEDGVDFLGDGAAAWASQTGSGTVQLVEHGGAVVEDVGQRRSLGRLSP